MPILRKDPVLKKSSASGKFAKGKKAVAICQRSGFKYLQKDMVFEPGTNYFVHKTETDKDHNLVADPLNFPPETWKKPEAQALRYASPDTTLSVGTVTSADNLAIITGLEPNANFEGYYPTTEASASGD